jgi:hypothetical protein
MEDRHIPRYQHFLAKRKRAAAEDARNIQALLRARLVENPARRW